VILPTHISSMISQQLANAGGGDHSHINHSPLEVHYSHNLHGRNMMSANAPQVAQRLLMQPSQLAMTTAKNSNNVGVVQNHHRSLTVDEAVLHENTRLMSNRRFDQQNKKQHKDQSNKDATDIYVVKSIVDTAVYIQQEAIFSKFLVAMLYQNNRVSGITKKMMCVVPLDAIAATASALDSPAHATLILGDITAFTSANLPGQLMSGSFCHSLDWLLLDFFKNNDFGSIDSDDDNFQGCKIQGQGMRENIAGRALIVGNYSLFSARKACFSLHVPGISKLWDGERIPVASRQSMEQQCTQY